MRFPPGYAERDVEPRDEYKRALRAEPDALATVRWQWTGWPGTSTICASWCSN